MRVNVLAFTRRGGEYALLVGDALQKLGHTATMYVIEKHCPDGAQPFGNVNELAARLWPGADAFVFVGASGIAVRSIAPLLRDKAKDPAVLVCDELGRFVIPLLSGHIGGANELAEALAGITGSQPVLTTATDINKVFSVDSWAVQNGMFVMNPRMIKQISGRLLEGEKVGFASDYPVKGSLPEGLEYAGHDYGISISSHTDKQPFQHTLRIAPINLVLGIGCRKGALCGAVNTAVNAALDALKLHPSSISRLCSIDIKENETGLLEYAWQKRLGLEFFSAEQLKAVPGEFSASEYVKHVTGVDNVCERSAVLGGGKGELIGRKLANGGITVAVFKQDFEVVFP